MSCGPGCFDNWTPSGLIRPHQPIAGGWRLESLPSIVKNDDLHWGWANQSNRKRASSPKDAVNHAVEFLKRNGHSVSKAVKDALKEHAEAQWRAAAPNRFLGRHREPTRAEKEKMGWARGFWELANLALINDVELPGMTVHRIAAFAYELLKSPLGCEKCEAHWKSVLENFPPAKLVETMPQARVWMWVAHNESREHHAPNSYAAVARAHEWPEVPDDEVAAIVAGMGMSELVANQKTR